MDSHSNIQLGKDLCLSLCGWWQHSIPCWVLDWGLWILLGCQPEAALSSSPHTPPQHGCLLSQSQQGRCDKSYVTSCKWLPITFAVFYLVNQVTGSSYTQGEGISEGHRYQETGSGELATLESVCHTTRRVGGRDHARCNLSEETQCELAFEEG